MRRLDISMGLCPQLMGVSLTAMLNSPGRSCLSVKFSSANLRVPYIDMDPVPSPLTKSPPCIMKSLIFCEAVSAWPSPLEQGCRQPTTRWNLLDLYPRGRPCAFLLSPVQSWRKFSAVRGVILAKSSIFIRPNGSPITECLFQYAD